MRRHDDRQPPDAVQLDEHGRDVELMPGIQRRRRLVEQQDVCLLRQRGRDDDALFLAAAQRREAPRLERRGARRRQRLSRDGDVARPFHRERAEMREPAHQRHLEHRVVERRVQLLRHDGDATRQLATRP